MSAFKNLGGAFKGGSSKRILILVLAFGLAGVAWWAMSKPAEDVNRATLRPINNNVETVQGAKPVTPDMDKALSVDDQRRADEAAKTGGSSIPTIRVAETRNIDLADPLNGEADNLEVPKRPEPPVLTMPALVAPPIAPPAPIQIAQNDLADPTYLNMGKQFDMIGAPVYKEALVKQLGDPRLYEPKADADPYANGNGGGSQQGVTSQSNFPMQLPLPGTVLYAEMISEANSDAPGPVLAEIVQGPLAGARLIGRFQLARDNLVIAFTTLSMGKTRDGEEINATTPIVAYGVDTKNIGTALATSRDYHLLQNVGLSFATAFAQGFGQAIAQSGQQVVAGGTGSYLVTNPELTTKQQLYVAGGTAAGAAGESLNRIFGNRPTTVKVASGTPLGVLFMPTNSGSY